MSYIMLLIRQLIYSLLMYANHSMTADRLFISFVSQEKFLLHLPESYYLNILTYKFL